MCLKLDEMEGTLWDKKKELVASDPCKDFWLFLLYILSSPRSWLCGGHRLLSFRTYSKFCKAQVLLESEPNPAQLLPGEWGWGSLPPQH